MQINIITVLFLLLNHYICDFIYQEQKIRVTKSFSIKSLLIHTIMYSFIFSLHLLTYELITSQSIEVVSILMSVLKFMGLTFVVHTVTDYITSKMSSFYYKRDDNFNTMNIIGLDQWTHYVQIILTYYLFFG